MRHLIEQKRENKVTTPKVPPQLLDLTKDKLVEHCLCVLVLNDPEDPIVVARYLDQCKDSGELVFQWMGSYKEEANFEDRISKQTWMNGWICKDTILYSQKKVHYMHKPWTNIMTGHEIKLEHILVAGFGLNKDCTVPRAVSTEALKKWKEYVLHPRTGASN